MFRSRSKSTRSLTSLATWKESASKYQTAINLVNVILLVLGVFIIGHGMDLMDFWHLTKLSFWSQYFVLFPWSFLLLGVLLFVTAIFSIGVSTRENSTELCYRVMVGLMGLLHIIVFLATLTMVFLSIMLNMAIQEEPKVTAVTERMKLYVNNDMVVVGEWDILQEDLRCCGGGERGYQTWLDQEVMFANTSDLVPAACCIPDKKGKTKRGCQKVKTEENIDITDVHKQIWVTGCVYVMQGLVRADIGPWMLVYAGAGAALAVVELLTAVLAFAYIATLQRRATKYTTGQYEVSGSD